MEEVGFGNLRQSCWLQRGMALMLAMAQEAIYNNNKVYENLQQHHTPTIPKQGHSHQENLLTVPGRTPGLRLAPEGIHARARMHDQAKNSAEEDHKQSTFHMSSMNQYVTIPPLLSRLHRVTYFFSALEQYV